MKLVRHNGLKSRRLWHAGSSPAARTICMIPTIIAFMIFTGMGIQAYLDYPYKRIADVIRETQDQIKEFQSKLSLDEDPNWFDPRWIAGVEIMPWQIHPYGKLWHERDLMGRNI